MKNTIKLFFVIAIFWAFQVTIFAKDANIVMEDLINTDKYKNIINQEYIKIYGENYMQFLKDNEEASIKADNIKRIVKYDGKDINDTYNFFGGIYIDKNNNVVVQIVEKNIPNEKNEEKNAYDEIIKDESIIVEYVDYSEKELNTIYNKIVDYYLSTKKSNIDEIYIDTINNRVIVNLVKYNDDEILNFKNKVDNSKLVKIGKGNNITTYTTFKPGAAWFNSGSECSWGYRAKAGTKAGMVTAGHCGSSGQTINGIGKVTKWKMSGNVDAMFVDISNTGNSVSNTLNITNPPATTTISTTVVSSFTVGQTLGKIGAESSFTHGSVSSTNNSINGLTGLIKTNFWAEEGDSGGIVFKYPDTSLGGYKTAGIVEGGPIGGGNFSFTKADNINTQLILSRY